MSATPAALELKQKSDLIKHIKEIKGIVPDSKEWETLQALEEAIGTNSRFYDAVKGVDDLRAYLNGASVENMLADARTGIFQTIGSAGSTELQENLAKITAVTVEAEGSAAVTAYRQAEIDLAKMAHTKLTDFAQQSRRKAVIDEALTKFGEKMPSNYGQDSLNSWARQYEDAAKKLIASPNATHEELKAANVAAETAKEIADGLSKHVSHVKDADGKFKRGENYGRELQRLKTRSTEIGEGLTEGKKQLVKDFNKAIDKCEETFGKMHYDIRNAFKLDGPNHDAEKLADKVLDKASKFGSMEGEFVQRFASKAKGVVAEAGKATEAAKELKGFAKVWSTGLGKAGVIGAGLAGLYIASKVLGGGSRQEATR